MNEHEQEFEYTPEHLEDDAVCPYPYGSGEHLAWELWKRFDSEIASYTLGAIEIGVERNVAVYLNAIFKRYGIEEAQFCALYLEDFELMPPISEKTRDLMMLARMKELMRRNGLCGNE